ncbi:ribosome small subunit-dependent GTPase A [Silvanigrella paludirubra]|uniref:Small ribosomal subunit biogenesis GTPase RsgA n=1 Tax=Silvanigrella paludirubra TaxID=2499159 RepID=A0A6N6VMY3_9BACT|nr:ribosome small subunit-dependent GTPase A [Silvanigrella paludirubra]KAB8036083.1 ribosome small subunit-dependent GTPase A [Silvanigrella paludirubra]
MARLKNFVDQDERRNNFKKIEKIKKEKRSVRGRIIDDWIIDSPNSDLTKKEMQEKLDELYKKGLRRGRVIEVQKRNVFIAEENEKGLPETENLWLCSVAKRHFQRAHKERNFVVVGDRILFEPNAELQFDSDGQPIDTDLPHGVVQHSFLRTSKISRKDPMHPEWEHVMLANIDLVAIVASVLNPEVRWGLIDRFLVQAEIEKIPAVIILNKVDLLENEKLASKDFLETYKKRIAIYKSIGYEIVEICALKPKKNMDNVKYLRKLFKGKLIGFAGHSGVGKSSLLNLMKPEFEQIVDENPDIFYKGRHTTTYNSLLQLDIGAYAIDTPGIRSFDINNYDPITLSYCFPEFRPFKCKYRECAHDHEPQCGIKQAVADGKISKERYRSYMGILKGVSFREGEGDSTDATMIADLKAREQKRDEDLAKEEFLNNEIK